MEVIYLHHPYDSAQIPDGDIALILGFFDGVHLGHQAVIQRGVQEAKKRGLRAVLMTFNQKPDMVLKKQKQMQYLTHWEQKCDRFEKEGISLVYRVDFTSAFASLKPQQFVQQYIVALHAKVVIAGYDYTYGPKDIATMDQLPLYANQQFEVISVPERTYRGQKIGSTRIRQLLRQGDIHQANDLLGYDYCTEGTIVHGDARGRTLGFPTANMKVDPDHCLPKNGIYIVSFCVNHMWYKGMTSIGHNVTFEAHRPVTIETYILDFDDDIYGETAVIKWEKRLRDEIKFDSVQALIDQLKLDEVAVRSYFDEETVE